MILAGRAFPAVGGAIQDALGGTSASSTSRLYGAPPILPLFAHFRWAAKHRGVLGLRRGLL